ncbi:hypothetical protein V8B97DRAFT_1919609 [Scleroderma yunnanense]
MTSIALSFAQPILVFLSPPVHAESLDSDEGPIYDVRTSKSIVSARALVPGEKAVTADGEFYEIVLPSCVVKEVEEAEKADIQKMVAKALRTDADKVGVKYLAHEYGGDRLMVVLDPSEYLEGRDVDINAFLTGRFTTYTLTHATPGRKTAFVSRSFMPYTGILEDHVCGIAHALMTPYYATQPDVDVVAGKEAFVRQVSPRGGDLWVTLDEDKGVVKLRGNAKLFAKGESYDTTLELVNTLANVWMSLTEYGCMGHLDNVEA